MDVLRKTYSFDHLDIAYYTAGQGKPLIFLHGWGSSSAVMTPLAQKLADTRYCILIDLPGFGETPEPSRSWSVGDYADMVEELVKNVAPDTEVDFLVHSFGGRILLKLLSSDQRQLSFAKLIVTGGAGLKPRRSLKYHLKRTAAKILKLPAFLVPSSKRENVLEKIRGTALWKSLGSSDYQQLSGVMRETFVKSVTEFFDDQLAVIDDEVLLIWGRDDAATPLDQARRLEKGLTNGTLIEIENAGHYAFLDQPARFTAIVKAYLTA